MITKVSYNAYASSANGMQRQNQPKNVNFGIGNVAVGNFFEEIARFSNELLPFVKQSEAPGNVFRYVDYPAAVGKLQTFLNFLEFCQANPEAKGQNLLAGIINLSTEAKGQKLTTNAIDLTTHRANVAYRSKKEGLESLIAITDFCEQHLDVSAENVRAGIIKEMPLEKLQGLLRRYQETLEMMQQ